MIVPSTVSRCRTLKSPGHRIAVVDDLVDKDSGQFIYPATVLKFVGDPNYFIISMPVISPLALASKPLAALDQLYSQILETSSDKRRTLDILCALIAFQRAIFILPITRTLLVELLRISEKLLGLQFGDGSQALRKIRSLVHIPERSLMLDDVDTNLPLPEYCDRPLLRSVSS